MSGEPKTEASPHAPRLLRRVFHQDFEAGKTRLFGWAEVVLVKGLLIYVPLLANGSRGFSFPSNSCETFSFFCNYIRGIFSLGFFWHG